MTPPGRSRPRSSASLMMKSPARSFTDPPGLRNSALPRIVQPVASEARRSLIIGVLPTVAMKPSRTFISQTDPGGRTLQTSGAKPSGSREPAAAQVVAVEEQPLYGDDRWRVAEAAGEQALAGLGKGHDLDANVLVFLRQAVDAADPAAVDAAAIELQRFAGTAGARQIVADGHQLPDLAAGFFFRLAMGDCFRRLTRIDDPRDDLLLPGRLAGGHGADPELLDEHHAVALGIVGQDAHRMAALEHFAHDLAAPAATEQA